MTSAPCHPLDNHHRAANDHHAALSELLDPFTQRRIAELPSWPRIRHCLEVGAGGGSVATWLADQVGRQGGSVVATDLKPDHIPMYPHVSAVGHDLTSEEPFGDVLGENFDLIHARLTLVHLPERCKILRRLADLLNVGGVLLIEDWAALRSDVVIAAPDDVARALYDKYQQVAGRIFDSGGTDVTWARRIHSTMLKLGLANVETIIHGRYWIGGGPGLRLIAATLPQLRDKLIAGGMDNSEIEALAELLDNPELVVHGYPLYSCAGTRLASQNP